VTGRPAIALLELDGIVAGYVEGIDILSGLTLRVEPGTVTGIIGPNGAGKSTLLKTVFGFLHPRQGRITFGGREIQQLAPHAIKRLGMSYVAQGTNVFPQLTVRENLQLGAWVFRRDGRRVAGMIERAFGAFPRLREKRWMRAKELVTAPALLLVDEPSAGLAPRIAHQVYERLLETRAQGVTILLVDQNITKAVEICDYLYLLEMGQVRREGPREAFADQLRELVRDALLGV
jgi:ABC-type branched-subunit amino acid transport system ATPase component